MYGTFLHMHFLFIDIRLLLLQAVSAKSPAISGCPRFAVNLHVLRFALLLLQSLHVFICFQV